MNQATKKLRARAAVFAVLAVLWMGVIFAYSAKTADESSAQSLRAGLLFGRIVHSDFADWPEAEQAAFAEKWDHPIRKTAHATEFAILGILWTGTIASYTAKHKASALKAMAISIAYAASDEFHQLFVPGRAGMVKDVFIDSCGVVLGCLVFGFVLWKVDGYFKYKAN